MENIKLEPCPFCGGKAKIKATMKQSAGFTIWCECQACNAKTVGYCPDINNEDVSIENIYSCMGYAVKKWNNRTSEA